MTQISNDTEHPAKEETLAGSNAILITCQDCGTRYEMGNGQLAAAEKRGHYHHLGHCPKCDRKTWSEAFQVRPMTRAEIAAAFHSPQNETSAATGSERKDHE